MKEGVGYGLLSEEQSAIVARVMELSDRSVGEEMVPWSRVHRVNADDPPSVLWRLAEETSVSRFPVTEPGGRVIGVVSLYDALLHRPENCPPLRSLARPAPELDRALPLREGLGRLRGKGVGLAIITDRGRPVGLATIKDLIEPITGGTGELVRMPGFAPAALNHHPDSYDVFREVRKSCAVTSILPYCDCDKDRG